MAEEKTVVDQTGEQIESLELQMDKVDAIPGCAVVSMKGYIDTYNAPHFQRQVDKAIQAGYFRLIFDFSGITYISSTGIGSFTHFLKELRPAGGDLVLVGMGSRVFEVFQLLGFATFFHVENSLAEAVEVLKIQSKAEAERPFPRIFSCPICGKKLKTFKAGRFRCAGCKTILIIDESARVSLG
jgi:anti-anti-sigma factor